MPEMESPVRVLIVDDSAIVRRVLSDTLSQAEGIEVVGTAPDPFVARNKILTLDPDVITLDIEMPRMDGLTFLRRIMQYRPKPVIVISSVADSGSAKALEALRSGAVDVVPKPGGPYSVGELKEDLPRKIRAAAQSRPRVAEAAGAALLSYPSSGNPVPTRVPSTQPAPQIQAALATASRAGTTLAANGLAGNRPSAFRSAASSSAPTPARRSGAPNFDLIAIGASTGGTQAVEAVLSRVSADCPPIVVTQHIPPGFSTSFAQRLNGVCAPEVREAHDGDALRPGLVLIAPGGWHMRVNGRSGALYASLDAGPKVCYQRPSVDVLFSSLIPLGLRCAAAVLLTGMGSDGADSMLQLRQAGFHTIAESEETCVVFGMPREAIRRNAAVEVLPLPRIASALGYL
jgi:two-component system chemotaxis response regulator CheB